MTANIPAVQRIAHPPFSTNGFSFLLIKPLTMQSLLLCSSIYAIISFTHSETGLRWMLRSTRNCSTIFFCAATLLDIVTAYKKSTTVRQHRQIWLHARARQGALGSFILCQVVGSLFEQLTEFVKTTYI